MPRLDVEHLGNFEALAICTSLVCATLYIAAQYAKDISFYYHKNWDFTLESGIKLFFGYIAGRSETLKMQAKTRLFFGFPFLISCFSFLSVQFIFDMFFKSR
jgi:hypothetical protein